MSPRLVRPLLAAAWLVVVGILAQAVLAGQGLFADNNLFGLHGGIGHGVLAVAVITAGLAWVARAPRSAAVLASLGVLALIAQTGLGYSGRRGGVAIASSLHVPLGVAILGVAVAVAVIVSLHRDATA